MFVAPLLDFIQTDCSAVHIGLHVRDVHVPGAKQCPRWSVALFHHPSVYWKGCWVGPLHFLSSFPSRYSKVEGLPHISVCLRTLLSPTPFLSHLPICCSYRHFYYRLHHHFPIPGLLHVFLLEENFARDQVLHGCSQDSPLSLCLLTPETWGHLRPSLVTCFSVCPLKTPAETNPKLCWEFEFFLDESS